MFIFWDTVKLNNIFILCYLCQLLKNFENNHKRNEIFERRFNKTFKNKKLASTVIKLVQRM